MPLGPSLWTIKTEQKRWLKRCIVSCHLTSLLIPYHVHEVKIIIRMHAESRVCYLEYLNIIMCTYITNVCECSKSTIRHIISNFKSIIGSSLALGHHFNLHASTRNLTISMLVSLSYAPLKLVSFPACIFCFCLVTVKKGLVDLHRLFCSTDSQILGVVNRC